MRTRAPQIAILFVGFWLAGAGIAQPIRVAEPVAVPEAVDTASSTLRFGNYRLLISSSSSDDFCLDDNCGSQYAFSAALSVHDRLAVRLGMQQSEWSWGEHAQTREMSLSCDVELGTVGIVGVGLELEEAWYADAVEPVERAALAARWELGSISGGLRGSTETDGALDLNIGWRTPWNARVSAGARNLFDERDPEDELDSPTYGGRIPYVRYQQEF